MRLHGLIDGIRGTHIIGPANVEAKMNATRLCLEAAYRHAAQFDFGDFDDMPRDESTELIDYSLALLEAGILATPFPIVAFSYRRAGLEHLTIAMDDGAGHIALTTFLEAKLGEGTIYLVTTSSLAKAGAFGRDPLGRRAIDLGWSETTMFAPPGVTPTGRITPELIEASGNIGFQSFCLACAILSADGVETRVHEAPVRLNKQRAKAGKAAIGEIREVIIQVGGKRYAPSGGAIGGGGTKRLHWRRGHIRRYADGKVTNVRPALIGKMTGAEPEPPMPTYAIKQAS